MIKQNKVSKEYLVNQDVQTLMNQIQHLNIIIKDRNKQIEQLKYQNSLQILSKNKHRSISQKQKNFDNSLKKENIKLKEKNLLLQKQNELLQKKIGQNQQNDSNSTTNINITKNTASFINYIPQKQVTSIHLIDPENCFKRSRVIKQKNTSRILNNITNNKQDQISLNTLKSSQSESCQNQILKLS